MRQAQKPVGERKLKCKDHAGMDLTFVCDQCENKLVCSKCITASHKGHTFSEPDEVAQRKRSDLKTTLQNINTKQTQLTKTLSDLSECDEINESSSEESIAKIQKTKKKLKEKIDEIADRQTEQCLKQKQENSEIITKANMDFLSLGEKLSEYQMQITNVLETGSDLTILEFDLNISDVEQTEVALPPIKRLRYIESGEKTETAQLFGAFEWENQQIKTSGNTVPVLSPSERPLPPRPKSSTPKREENTLYTEISQLFYKYPRLRAVCPNGKRSVWVTHLDNNNCYTKQIGLVRQDGGSTLNAVVDAQITDAASMPDGTGSGIISCWDKSIRKIEVDGSCSLLFNTDAKPTGICVDNNNNIIVTFREEGKIVKYNFDQDKVKVLKSSKRSMKLFSKQESIKNPDGICASESSNDIAVIDADRLPRVVVLTGDLKIRHGFNGEDIILKEDYNYDAIQDKPYLFGPNGICYDKHDNLYIADGGSLSVLVLNSFGICMNRFHCGSAKPCGLGFDNEGLLWIGLNNGKIKIYKQKA